jgi:hypothetical protein
VKTASDYQAHANECRVLARNMQGQQRDQLLQMAATWERLAADRSVFIRRHPELAQKGEHEEAAAAAATNGRSNG